MQRNIVNIIWGNFIAGRAAWGLLVLRLVFGGALTLHGIHKMSSPLGWMGADAPVPGIFQFLAFLSEFAGGLALMFGLLTPLAALGVLSTMAVALLTAHATHPWVASGGPSKESALGYLAFALTILLTGPGRLSLDALMLGQKEAKQGAVLKSGSPGHIASRA